MPALIPLLSDIDKQNILKYKYNGGDSSPVYQYILSPIAQYCVENFVPRWVAPNVVTSLGLLAAVVSLIVTLHYNPSLSSLDVPRWVFVLNGIGVFAYQTFDNMDGKQARRTGSSSPLGMLFDHGCDALNSGIMCIPMASVVATGWTPKMFMCIWSGFVPFYFQALEEYYTGTMVLPPFNGPTEGLLIASAMCFITAAFGPQFWHQPIVSTPSSILAIISHFEVFFRTFIQAWSLPSLSEIYKELSPYEIVVTFAVVSSSIIAVTQVYTILCAAQKQGLSAVKVLLDLLPFLVFFPSALIWFTYSDIAFPKYPLVAFFMVSLAFVESLMHIMLSHICEAELKPFQRYVSKFLLLLLFVQPTLQFHALHASLHDCMRIVLRYPSVSIPPLWYLPRPSLLCIAVIISCYRYTTCG